MFTGIWSVWLENMFVEDGSHRPHTSEHLQVGYLNVINLNIVPFHP